MLQVNGINIKLIRVSATTTPQALVEEIQEFWKMYSSPVFIELPNQPLQHIEAFYGQDSFNVLNRLRREYNTAIIFIIPAGVRLTNEAKRSGFPVYSSFRRRCRSTCTRSFSYKSCIKWSLASSYT